MLQQSGISPHNLRTFLVRIVDMRRIMKAGKHCGLSCI